MTNDCASLLLALHALCHCTIDFLDAQWICTTSDDGEEYRTNTRFLCNQRAIGNCSPAAGSNDATTMPGSQRTIVTGVSTNARKTLHDLSSRIRNLILRSRMRFSGIRATVN